MGKKNNKKRQNNTGSSNLPNVSICTPTFNRRPFFKGLIQCIKDQDYPHNKLEWIIVDDGFDKVEDIIDEARKTLNDIKITYCYESEKMPLGKKRNYMHSKCSFQKDDDIIVYMDDDDYYPPDRVSHAVQRLNFKREALCAGSSEIFIWFNTLDKMYKFGPYGPNHATAGTFAFRRKLLKQSHYEDDAVLAEEKHFLKNYTVPFVQLDPFKTILVFSHEQNTFDKRRLISKDNAMCKESFVKCKTLVTRKEQIDFYTQEIGEMLKDYDPGNVKHKPEVLKEIDRRDKERAQMAQQSAKNIKSGICISDKDGKRQELTNGQIMQLLQNNAKQVHALEQQIKEKDEMIKNLTTQLFDKTNS
jgi:glycosyltransferase involved in cell wall biosynthesis